MAFKFLLGPKMSIRIRAKYQRTPSPLFHWVVVNSLKSGVSLLGFKFQLYPLVAVWAWENNWTSLSVHFLICIVGKWILPTCISQDMLGNAAVTSDPKNDHPLTTKHYLTPRPSSKARRSAHLHPHFMTRLMELQSGTFPAPWQREKIMKQNMYVS